MTRLVAVLAALAAGVIAAPGGARADESPAPQGEHDAGSGVFERSVVEVEPHEGVEIDLVEIDNRIGDVRIEGHDRDSVVILAYKRAPSEEVLDRLKVSLVPDPEGPVRIGTAIEPGREMRPIAAGAVTIDLVIRAPRSARAVARVWSGLLEVQGMENGADLSAATGNIEVTSVLGAIVTHQTRGHQRLREVVGSVDAQGIHSDVDIDVVRGERLSASVHEGDIGARRVRAGSVVLRTTRGDISFVGEAVAGGRLAIRSYRGNVEVKISRAGTTLSVWAQADTGDVDLPAAFKPKRKDGGVTVGALGAKGVPAMVQLRSRVGNIQFAVLEE